MTSETRQKKPASPFRGKARADNGGDFKTEVPSADTHEARVVALIDLGTHMESYQGSAEKEVRKCLLAFELDEEMTGTTGVNHVVIREYTMSFHEKASLRQLAEALLNDGQKFIADADDPTADDIDYEDLLGRPCLVQISHQTSKTDKGDRTYAKLGTISAVPKKKQDKVFKPQRKPAAWYVGDDLATLPDYLPRIYGEPVRDKIARCKELRRGSASAAEEAEDAGEDTPF